MLRMKYGFSHAPRSLKHIICCRRIVSSSTAANTDGAARYLEECDCFRCAQVINIKEITVGRINHVYEVSVEEEGGLVRSVLLKYCPPYVKSLGAGVFPLAQDRLHVEAMAMLRNLSSCPQHTPRLLHHDPEHHVIVQEYLESHVELSTAIHKLKLQVLQLSEQLAEFLSSTLYKNSVYNMTQGEWDTTLNQFSNREIVMANERVVLTEPFDRDSSSNQFPEDISELVEQLRSNPFVLQRQSELLHSYRTKKESLLHHDLHLGNILVGLKPPLHPSSIEPVELSGTLFVIDYEFATIGPMAYDVGSLVGNLLLAFITLRSAHGLDVAAGLDVNEELWRDSLGFAALCMIRLTIGMHHYQALEALPNAEARSACSYQALTLAIEMLGGKQSEGERIPEDVQQLVLRVKNIMV